MHVTVPHIEHEQTTFAQKGFAQKTGRADNEHFHFVGFSQLFEGLGIS